MRIRFWCTSLVLASLALACGDQPTEVVPEREMTQGPGAIAAATSSSGDGLSITTDKDDYAPGDTVWFTGAGWTPGDVLDIALTDEPTNHRHEWTIGVGEDGTFRDSTYVVDIEDLGVTFTLTATSRGNPAQTLTVMFTDGNVRVKTNGVTITNTPPGTGVTWIKYNGNAVCAGSGNASGSAAVGTALVGLSGVDNGQSIRITVPAAVSGQNFTSWTLPSGTVLGWRSEERRVGKECRSRWSPYH